MSSDKKKKQENCGTCELINLWMSSDKKKMWMRELEFIIVPSQQKMSLKIILNII